MTWARNCGGKPHDYPRFAAGYGRSFEGDALAEQLATLRLLAPTVNMVLREQHSMRHRLQAQRRLRYWLGDPDRPTWTAQ
ncbi:MAG: hypothetical protein ACE5MI_13305 [Acidimicrobiia bacterium]